MHMRCNRPLHQCALQIYSRPTFEFVEVSFMRLDQSAMSKHNVIVRLIITTIYVVIITTLSCMLPFFADFVALCGAIGFTPLVCLTPGLPTWPLAGHHGCALQEQQKIEKLPSCHLSETPMLRHAVRSCLC